MQRGGCSGQVAALMDEGAPGSSKDMSSGLYLPTRLSLGSRQRMKEDERTLEVWESWSECMANKGYEFQTPYDPLEDERFAGDGAATQLEIDTAVADVECKHETNVLGVMYGVNVEYEEMLINEHFESLQVIEDWLTTATDRYAELLAEHG